MNIEEMFWGIDTKKLYRDCESVDGYYRDRCVFSDDIDIEDTMSVNVKYFEGALLSYSLIAHSPYEGFKASINGVNGRSRWLSIIPAISRTTPVSPLICSTARETRSIIPYRNRAVDMAAETSFCKR